MKNNNYYLCEGYKEKKLNKKVLYFHIPKCGGTTVTNILAHLFLWQSKTFIRIKKEQFENNRNNILKEKYDFVYGHIPYYYTKYFPDRFLLTVIRDPVERYISHLNHEMHRNRIPKDISVEECLEKELIPLNLMTRIFSKEDMINKISKKVDTKNLEDALLILTEKIDLVIDISNINLLINYVISNFNFPNVLYQWTQQSKANFFYKEDYREIISYYNSLDIKLYSSLIKNNITKNEYKKYQIRENQYYLLFNNEIKINDKKNIFYIHFL